MTAPLARQMQINLPKMLRTQRAFHTQTICRRTQGIRESDGIPASVQACQDAGARGGSLAGSTVRVCGSTSIVEFLVSILQPKTCRAVMTGSETMEVERQYSRHCVRRRENDKRLLAFTKRHPGLIVVTESGWPLGSTTGHVDASQIVELMFR